MAHLHYLYAPHRESLTAALLADVLDALGHRTSALPHELRPLKRDWRVFGRARTLSAVPVAAEPARPYALEMECIDALTAGDVLVATTHGDRSCALWGELLSTACKARGVAGIVLDGLTRDAARIVAMDFPVFAAGYSPLDSKGRLDAIARDVPVRLGDCLVRPGDWVVGDVDGIVVVPEGLAEQALERALQKATGESRVRVELARGRSVAEVFAEHGIL